jgi:[ribosomal protein S5]-alanine N-acetyltransferase
MINNINESGDFKMDIESIYGNLPRIETKRLILRKITKEDVPSVFAYASNSLVSQYVMWNTHKSLADSAAFVTYVLNQYHNGQVAPWAIELKENGEMIGTVDFVWWKPNHRSAEFGYVLSPLYWKQGIMTEAVKALIDFGFTKMDLNRIQARCYVENVASERIMQKAGLQFEGIMRQAVIVKNVKQDLKIYAILKEDWEVNKIKK